ncbi:uncharacterized protein LOC122859601 [Aphidius gifuensis]|uniref:uncharacterized protein LOC122859601 n=1 Tax=Aphidius gifuensis TaxID=684658 RepID=UPI001CDD454F|nr:uncharacterized protein LOC122859601 [Aphidius gifuensis]
MSEVLIIDIQCLVGSRNEYYPKEISVLTLHDKFISHWIIGPPFKYSKLEKGARRQNNWLTKNYHKIDWDASEVPYKNLQSLIEKIGELENISPRFGLLPADEHYCLFHGVNYPNYTCTQQNVYKLKNWLIGKKLIIRRGKSEDDIEVDVVFNSFFNTVKETLV